METISRILSCSPAHLVCELAEQVLQDAGEPVLISGPRSGLVQLRLRDGVAAQAFNAGEIVVTEVRLELAGRFGFGMVIGRDAHHATAIAVLDAALGLPGDPYAAIRPQIAALGAALAAAEQRRFAAAAATHVAFETF
jgi:alpha-D-ribose 1-methylphosphonate 5-triphosphate synthase subunit PhnG